MTNGRRPTARWRDKVSALTGCREMAQEVTLLVLAPFGTSLLDTYNPTREAVAPSDAHGRSGG